MYARKHDDFSDLLAEAAMENLFDTILTDDLFKPVEGFTPTDEERAKMEEAEKNRQSPFWPVQYSEAFLKITFWR